MEGGKEENECEVQCGVHHVRMRGHKERSKGLDGWMDACVSTHATMLNPLSFLALAPTL